ncbi:MAG: three-Cys-motif partner protein TcmP [Acidimicrobiaceae bacterium]|nr:three-Cys-motif partner protein TcmP [Acidimicrobiaceae bacterium]
MSRTWGYWTRGKLEVLRDYLNAFTTATKNNSRERIYLDLFAGGTDNLDRVTKKGIQSSAQIALSIDDPPFTRLRFFEVADKAQELESALATEHPGRDIKIYPGDCNHQIQHALEELKHLSWAPTFAFIDPNCMEAKWSTLKQLSEFRTKGRKTELFLLFSPQMFSRLLPTTGQPLRPEDIESINGVFGTQTWRNIYKMRLDESLDGGQAREEYLNLMRWRLENELGYRWTHPLELKNTRGSSIYFMIFATSHKAGNGIMSHLYNTAADKFPDMRKEAVNRIRQAEEESSGVMRLFSDATVSGARQERSGTRYLYVHQPPHKPSFGY